MRMIIGTLRYFFIYGIPEMWKRKEFHIKTAWFAAKMLAKVKLLKAAEEMEGEK